MASLVFCFIILTIFAKGDSLPIFGHTCLKSPVPPTNARGVNRQDSNSDAPMYRLEIAHSSTTSLNGEENLMYKVQIVGEGKQFREARITMEQKGLCDTGSVTFNPYDYFEASQVGKNCPKILLTNGNLPKNALPSLSWKPPSCGCVRFRVVVTSLDKVYYFDNEDAENGPLSQTVCVHEKATRDQYLSALCQVQERYSAADIISRPSFLLRHQLEVAQMDRHGLELGLELRRSDNRLCCSESSMEAKLTCFDDSRRRRVDQFCEDGNPDIPFTFLRTDHMRDREINCCFLLGEHRYSCFAEKSELAPGPSMILLDFSMDETDPVNDLAVFGSIKNADVVKIINNIKFGENENKTNNNNDEEDDDINNDKGKEEETPEKVKHQQGKLTKGKNPENVKDVNTPLDISKSPSAVTDDFHSMERNGLADGTKAKRKKEPYFGNFLKTSSERGHNKGGSREITRRNSGEVEGDRRTSSREYFPDEKQISSREQILNDRRRSEGKRGSGEKIGRKKESAEKKKSLGAGLPRDRGSSSVERRKEDKTSSQKKGDWVDPVIEPDFEDQGGKSFDGTLNKLRKQRDRAELRERCCEAGAVAGRPVYGFYGPVKKECEHSMNKFMRSEVIKSGVRSCQDQFLICCMEQAVSGPAITSSEFKDNQFLYVNNVRKLGSQESLSQLQRHDLGQSADDFYHEELTRDDTERETPEAYEQDTEKRFKKMREIGEDPHKNIDENEDYNGPRRFDEADNEDNDYDILDRKEIAENPLMSGSKEDDKIDVRDDADAVERGEFKGSSENKKQRIGQENKKTKEKKKEAKKDQLHRESALVDSLERPESEKTRSRDDFLLAKTSGGRSRRFQNSREVEDQSKGGSSISRGTRYRALGKGSSRKRYQERYQFAPTYYVNGRTYKHVPSGKIGTEDSQEMAAAHVKRTMATLDSKEMAEAYKNEFDDEDKMINDDAKQRSSKKRSHNIHTWFF